VVATAFPAIEGASVTQSALRSEACQARQYFLMSRALCAAVLPFSAGRIARRFSGFGARPGVSGCSRGKGLAPLYVRQSQQGTPENRFERLPAQPFGGVGRIPEITSETAFSANGHYVIKSSAGEPPITATRDATRDKPGGWVSTTDELPSC